MSDQFKKRARRERRTAKAYLFSLILISIIAAFGVYRAQNIAKDEIEEASERTVSIPGFLDFHDVAITTEGKEIIAGENGLILMSDQYISETLGHVNSVGSHGGDKVVAVGDDGLFQILKDSSWDDKSVETRRDFNGFAFKKDFGVAVGDNGLIAICKESCEQVLVKYLDSSWLVDVAIGENGDIAVVERKGNIMFFKKHDLISKEKPAPFWSTNLTEKRVHGISFSEDGKFLAAVGRNGLAVIFSRSEGKWMKKDKSIETKNDLNAVAFSNDGRSLVAVGDRGRFSISTFENGRWDNWRHKQADTNDDVLAVAFHEDGSVVAVGKDRSVFRTENLSDGRIMHSYIENAKFGNIIGGVMRSEISPYSELIYANTLRIGIVVVFLLWARVVSGMMRFHKRLEASYTAIQDAVDMMASSPAKGKEFQFRTAVDALSPKDTNF